jgi:hypothetical protein
VQIYATVTSPLVTGIGVGTGASKYTDIVTQSAKTLASGSNASVTDQLNAYQTLLGLVVSDVGSDGGLLDQTNKNDAQRAVAALNNAPIIQQMEQLGGQFGATLSSAMSSGAENGNTAQNTLDTLSRYSQDDQQIIFVSAGFNVPGALVQGGQDLYYASVDDWKAALKQQAAAFNAQQQASTTAQSSTVVAAISSPAAPASTAGPAATAKPSIQTLLTSNSPSATNANIALQILLSDQARTHAESSGAAKAAAKPGTAGTSGHTESAATATQQATLSAPASSSGPINVIA